MIGRLVERLAGQGGGSALLAGALAASVVALAGWAACLACGVVLALFPENWYLGWLSHPAFAGDDTTLLGRALDQAVAVLRVRIDVLDPVGRSINLTPLLLLLVPLAALALTAGRATRWLGALRPRARLWWGVAAAIPFAALAALTASRTGDVGASSDSALRFGLVWGAIGGLAGTLHTLRRTVVYADTYMAERWDDRLRLAGAALRPLGVLVLFTAVVGALAWSVQAVRDNAIARSGRPTAAAVIENVPYAGEHGINYAALGAGVELSLDNDGPALPAVPVDDPQEVDGVGIDPLSGAFGAYRIFGFADAMPVPLFALLAIALIGAVLAAALYAGMAVARAARAENPATGAVFGLLVGPIWAIVAWMAVQLHSPLPGLPGQASTFLMALLVGGIAGAVGGALYPRVGRFLLSA
jgi:hypothetical protein